MINKCSASKFVSLFSRETIAPEECVKKKTKPLIKGDSQPVRCTQLSSEHESRRLEKQNKSKQNANRYPGVCVCPFSLPSWVEPNLWITSLPLYYKCKCCCTREEDTKKMTDSSWMHLKCLLAGEMWSDENEIEHKLNWHDNISVECVTFSSLWHMGVAMVPFLFRCSPLSPLGPLAWQSGGKVSLEAHLQTVLQSQADESLDCISLDILTKFTVSIKVSTSSMGVKLRVKTTGNFSTAVMMEQMKIIYLSRVHFTCCCYWCRCESPAFDGETFVNSNSKPVLLIVYCFRWNRSINQMYKYNETATIAQWNGWWNIFYSLSLFLSCDARFSLSLKFIRNLLSSASLMVAVNVRFSWSSIQLIWSIN